MDLRTLGAKYKRMLASALGFHWLCWGRMPQLILIDRVLHHDHDPTGKLEFDLKWLVARTTSGF